MRHSTWLCHAAALGCLAFSTVAGAQGTAVITGIVTDAASGAPVPDVVVTATSPSLQGEEIVVTDGAGLYRIPQLPAGNYTLKLEKDTYRPYSRPDVIVRTDRTIRVNIQLQPEAVQGETIVVVGKAPTVDVGNTATGLNVGQDFINNLSFITPNAAGVRSFESLSSAAPQVIQDDYGFGFSGAQSPENLYVVDGVSVGDPAYGVNAGQFPVDFVQEANVITGGYQAEYGRSTGGVLNVVTKSGSNEFHGSVWGNWTPGLLSAESPVVYDLSSSIQRNTRRWNTIDFGVELGGPIVKDKLWFYVGFSPSFDRQGTRRWLAAFDSLAADVDSARIELPGSRVTRLEDARSFSYIAKLTYLLNADHTLSLSVIGSPTETRLPFALSTTHLDWRGGTVRNQDSSTVSLRYQGGFFDKHLLAEASVGWFRFHDATYPDDGSTFENQAGDGSGAGTPAVIFRADRPISAYENLSAEALAICARNGVSCPGTGNGATYQIGGLGFLSDATQDRIQGRASLTWLVQALGHHVVKAGLDVENLRYDLRKGYSGEVILRENVGGTRFDDYRQFGYFTGPDTQTLQHVVVSQPTSTAIGAYAQDSWSIMDLVTVNLGLRYDNQQLFAGDGTLGLTLNNMISPRVGLIYDFTQQGRSKLYANFARYYEAVPIDIADRALTGENQISYSHQVAGHPEAADPATNPGCDPLSGDLNQAINLCRDPRNTRQQPDPETGGPYSPNQGVNVGTGRTPIDPNLQPQSSDEIVVGGEYELISDGRLGVVYTHRYVNYVIEDMSIDEASTYFLGNPGYGIASQFPKAVRDYDAVSVYFSKAFSDGWMAQASYTYSSLRGNYNGLYNPETLQLDPNINADFDLVSLLANRTGPLAADRNHSIKVFGAKEFVINQHVSVLTGLTYTGRSGAPINYLGSHVLYGPDEVYVLARGSGGRLPWVHSFNLKAGVTYRLTKDTAVSFTADIFNLFNFQAATAVDQTLTSAEVEPYRATTDNPQREVCIAGNQASACPQGQLPLTDSTGAHLTTADLNSNFKQPTAYQQPISVRFGLKLTF